MANIWVISDTHFGHRNILNFTDEKGELIRGKVFKSIEEHDEALVKNWNDLVSPQDHVYHLGDVVLARRNMEICRRLNGHKRLVRGNHDIFSTKEYIDVGFEEIYGVRVWPKHNIIMSHIPLHRDSLTGRSWLNIHGHLHQGVVKMEIEVDTGIGMMTDYGPDPLYRCVSVEHTDYKPVLIMT